MNSLELSRLLSRTALEQPGHTTKPSWHAKETPIRIVFPAGRWTMRYVHNGHMTDAECHTYHHRGKDAKSAQDRESVPQGSKITGAVKRRRT